MKRTSTEGTPPNCLVHYTIDIKATKIEYTVRMTAERPARLDWVMTKGQMMRVNRGHWALRPVADGTEATYNIELKLGALVPGFIEKMLAEQSLPGMLANFKARAEKLYPKSKAVV